MSTRRKNSTIDRARAVGAGQRKESARRAMGAHIHGTGGGPSTRAERESQHGSMCRQHVAACCGSIYAAVCGSDI